MNRQAEWRERHQQAADGLLRDMSRRLAAGPPGLCPVDTALGFVTMCHSQSCGKCVPCRVGLGQLRHFLGQVLSGEATPETMDLITRTASTIRDSADCVIGSEAARLVLASVAAFRDEYLAHIERRHCLGSFPAPVPCRALCPAGVDVPGYVALIHEGRSDEAIGLIRRDNPFPATCGYVCEHPCESHCRRNLMDYAVNIRALKRYAVDHSGEAPAPARRPDSGRRVAVIGGGPSGLACAYFLARMGVAVKLFERRRQLGGMLRYGIPAYRLPRELLDKDIRGILAAGIEAETETDIDGARFRQIRDEYDAVYVTIGAHRGGRAGIPGEDLKGVSSAVDLLRRIGDGNAPNCRGKRVAVIGGGNVAMDVARTALRLGAERVYCVYRRRKSDMTALPEEIEGAVAEGAELLTLKSPVRIEGTMEGWVSALWVKPQIPGRVDRGGRPRPVDAELPEERLPVDVVVVAVGQSAELEPFAAAGMPTARGVFTALPGGRTAADSKVYTGGECVTGPATVIRAIAAGKDAARGICAQLGVDWLPEAEPAIPLPVLENKPVRGRVNTEMRVAFERKNDFGCIELGLTDEGAATESSRCLRCDYFGCGAIHGRGCGA